ncbi:two-component sensor histidine kinase [Clostridium zeae]|uniref:histidine kinase n=1 Tax=Clostridium zeae TaxID=2759022 RepID=A0ABQ1ED91_9CLOT|nr:HAMP domain-containing sensor histidine kinase [Clostridium zeae]GFZ32742.1 two-component sensor histidine kinase [Clostridium zeae]
MKLFKKAKKSRGLQWQVFSRFFMILIVLLFIMGLTQYFSMRDYLCKSKEQVLQAKFHNIDFKVLGNIDKVDENNSELNRIVDNLVDRITSAVIIDKGGNVDDKVVKQENEPQVNKGNEYIDNKIEEKLKEKLAPVEPPTYDKSEYIKLLKEPGNLEKDYKIFKGDDNTLQLVVWRKIGDMNSPTGLIQLSTPINDVGEILDKQMYIYLGGAICMLMLGGAIGGTVFKQTLNPLKHMTNTVEQIDIKELHTRIPEDNGLLEIDSLSHSFNNMLERIETSFEKEQYIKEKMRRFVSDASHELRTPLTSIHGFVEILLRGAAKNEQQLNLALNSILLESDRLTKLVNDLLVLSKLDQNIKTEINEEDLKEVVEEIAPQLTVLCESRELVLDLNDEIKVNINKNQIKQVIYNLTQNAVLHTDKENGKIKISTKIQNIDNEVFAVLSVSDNGTGITEEHISKIYDRFFRSDTHRSREHGGYGLGLSIVKGIIDSHNGKIEVESELGKGSKFTVYLKLNKV